MALFQVNVSKETGEVILLMETRCGFRPVMGWPSTNGFKEFAEMLLGIHSRITSKRDNTEEAADRLLRQALGDEKNLKNFFDW